MMNTLKRLVSATENTTINNHAVTVYEQGKESVTYYAGAHKFGSWGNIVAKAPTRHMAGVTRYFSYHGNTICLVDDVKKKMILTHAGWCTRSTSRALNEYRAYFTAAGYQVVEEY